MTTCTVLMMLKKVLSWLKLTMNFSALTEYTCIE